MKKLITWFLSVVILAIVIAAGFFYYQSNPNILSNKITTSNNKEASTTSNVVQSQSPDYEIIPLDKLPADVQLKDIITEYPLKIGTVNDKAILKIIKKDLLYKNQANNTPALEQIEIIFNGKSIYQEKSNQLVVAHDKNSNTYMVSSNEGFFSEYALIKGNTKDYFLYYIDEPGNAEGIPYYYKVVSIETNNQKHEVLTLKGEVLLSSRYDFSNPKLEEHTYKLLDDKYIVSTFYNHIFGVVAYYEISDSEVKLVNKEFGINLEEDNQAPDKNKMKEVGSIILYSKPDINSASKSVKLSEKTQIKLLGIKYVTPRDMDSMTHIIIDNEEGWIDYGSLINNLGFSFSG